MKLGLTVSELLNPFMNPEVASNETVPAHPAHLISILPAIARLLLIGWEIDMQDICGAHYSFFLSYCLDCKWKGGSVVIRLLLMNEKS